jgi:hypothetical protein
MPNAVIMAKIGSNGKPYGYSGIGEAVVVLVVAAGVTVKVAGSES